MPTFSTSHYFLIKTIAIIQYVLNDIILCSAQRHIRTIPTTPFLTSTQHRLMNG